MSEPVGIPCGVCKGDGKVKSKKKLTQPDAVCPICGGSGESVIANDANGHIIIPGRTARIVRRHYKELPDDDDHLIAGCKGTIRYVAQSPKGIVVTIVADPNMSALGRRSKNHGTYSARPEHVKQFSKNANLARLKRYKEAQEAKKEEEKTK